MTLSDDAVIEKLNRDFVCGWKNIKGATPYAGTSNTHMPGNAALEVSNCAGHHNVQMVFMTSEGRVLHVLPGFWNPRHLVEEMDLAADLGKLYYQKGISAAERNAKYLDLHLRHALDHSAELRGKSYHQGFDKMNLEKREESDFHRKEGFISYGLKTPDQVIHERLAERPFTPWASFDVRKAIDMGQRQYSYDHGLPGKMCPSESGKPAGAHGPKGDEKVRGAGSGK